MNVYPATDFSGGKAVDKESGVHVENPSGWRTTAIWRRLTRASPSHDTKRAMQSRHLTMLGAYAFLVRSLVSHYPLLATDEAEVSHRRNYRYRYISECWVGYRTRRTRECSTFICGSSRSLRLHCRHLSW